MRRIFTTAAIFLVFAVAAIGAESVPKKLTDGIARVFDPSRLHKIEIVIPESDVPKLIETLEVRLKCTFSFDGVQLKNVGIRQSSGAFHPFVPLSGKPSLSIKFDEFVKGQDLYGIEKIVLKNGLQDLSWINEHMAYEVFRRAGLAAPMTAHAQVIVNGIDLGLYVIREPISKQFLTRNFGSENDDGNLYELGVNRTLYELANAPNGLELKDEKKDGRKRDDLNRLAATVGVVPPEYFTEAVSQSLDLNRYITYFAAEAVSSVMDGFSFHNNNTYLYNNPKDGRFALIPYGADEAFWVAASAGIRVNNPFQAPMGLLPTRIQSIPALMAQFKSEVARVSQAPVWDKAALHERVTQVAKILAAANKTPRLEADIARFNTYRPAIDNFIDFNGTTVVLERK